VADTGELLVSFNVGVFALSADFSAQITFPDRFNDEDPYFATGSLTCRNGTANIASAPTCSSVADSATGISVITVTGLYTSSIGAADTASFYIANIKNPVSAAVVSGISMRLYNPTSTNHIIASKSSLTMQITTAKSVTSFAVSFNTPSTIGVYSTANAFMALTIVPGVLVEAGCRVSVSFPTDITYQSTVFTFGIINAVSYSSGNNSVGNIQDSECPISDSVTADINIYVKVQGPPQKKATDNFVFSMTTSAGAVIASGTANVAASLITTGTITNFVFAHTTTASTTVQEVTEWKIGFTLANPLTNPWVITVTYPNGEFSITGCTPSNGVGFTIGSTTCGVSGNTLTIEGSYDLAAGAVSMEGVIGTNPTAVFDTGTFTVNSFNNISSANYAVDQYDSSDTSFTNPFQATAQTLNSVSVAINSAGNNVTGLTSVQYDFTVSHKSTFPANSIVKLTIPSSNCLTMYDSGGTSVSTIEFTNLITTSKDNTTDLTFSWTNFTNPRSTNTACGVFTVAIANSAGNDLESGTGGTITIGTSNTLGSFEITPNPTSLINGGTAEYAISSAANSNTPLIAGDRYIITFPSEIDISSVTCTNCARDSGNLIYTVPSSPTDPITFTMSAVEVQYSNQPISTAVTVSVVTSTSTSQIISTHSTTTVPTTSVAGTLTSVSLAQASQVASEQTTYTFGFTLANKVPAGGVITIINTPALTFALEGSCTVAAGSFDACTYESSINGVQIPVNTEITAGTSVSISIANYTNPSAPTGTSFTVRTFTTSARSFFIDEIASGLVPSLECDYPCKTCSSSNSSECLTCFTTITSIPEKYHISTNNTCASSCPTDYSTDSTNFNCTI
jgi:hypothetical protein